MIIKLDYLLKNINRYYIKKTQNINFILRVKCALFIKVSLNPFCLFLVRGPPFINLKKRNW